jgi:hypothetical protein
MGRPTPIQAQLSLSRSGYAASVRGEAGIQHLLQSAQLLHFPSPQVSAEGVAALDLNLAGGWDSAAPVLTGSALLRGVHAQVRGLNSPLQIRHADLAIDAESVHVKNLEALAGEASWHGSLLIPRPCVNAETCKLQFHLRSPEASSVALNRLLNPSAAKRPWYKILAISNSYNYFSKANATGSVVIDKLLLGGTTCTRFSSNLELDKAKLSLTNVKGNLLGGVAAASLKADFSVRPPVYSGTGDFDGISMSSIAGLMRRGWIDGDGSASYRFKTSGWNLQDALKETELDATFTIQDGDFPHVILSTSSEPLHASAFSGRLAFQDGNFSLDNSELITDSGVFNISGTATLAGALNLKMSRENSTGYNISGTLDQTRVSPIPSPPTQAALKP